MCQIMYMPKGSYINKRHVYTSQKNNPHGIGMMWVEGGRVKVYRGKKSYTEIIDELRKHSRHDLILHMRYATRGSHSNINCHPFKILDYNQDGIDLYMMHNWTLPIGLGKTLHSDSYHLAQELRRYILKHGIESLYNPRNADLLGRVIGVNNRVIFLDSNNKVTYINKESGLTLGKSVKRWYANRYSLETSYRKKTKTRNNVVIQRIKKKKIQTPHRIKNMVLRRYNIVRYMLG
jgi:predicted glutamine amidotransferase